MNEKKIHLKHVLLEYDLLVISFCCTNITKQKLERNLFFVVLC